MYILLSLIKGFAKTLKDGAGTNRESVGACKSTNVQGDVTLIRPETLPSRHLENLRIKRFVGDANGGEIIRLFPAIKRTPPRSVPLQRHEGETFLVASFRTFDMSFTFRVWRRMKRHRNDGKGEREACVDGEIENGESGESDSRRGFFFASGRCSCESGHIQPSVRLVFRSGAPILRYRNASRKPNLNDYERDDTMPLVSHTAVRVF